MTKRLANRFAGGEIRKDRVCLEVSSVCCQCQPQKHFPSRGRLSFMSTVFIFSLLLPTKVTYYIHTSLWKTCLKAFERTNSDVLFSFFSVWTITFWLTYPPIHFANMTQALFSITRKFDCCHNETRCCNKGSFNQKWTTLSYQRNDKEPHRRLLAVRHVFPFNADWLLPRVWDIGKPL